MNCVVLFFAFYFVEPLCRSTAKHNKWLLFHYIYNIFFRLIYLSFNSLSPLPISSSYIFLFFSTVCSCVCDMFRFFVVVFEHHINGIAMCAHTHTHHLEQRINNEEKKEWNRTTTTTKKTEDSKSNSKELNGHAKERKLKSSRKQ